MFSRLSRGYKVSTPGAGVAAICFFLPWILVSCNRQPVAQLSGWDLAAGTTVGSGFSAQQIPGTPLIFLVFLAALGVFALAYFALQRGYLTKLDGFGLIGIGALPLLMLFYQFSGSQAEAARQGYRIEFQYGLWGLVLGYIAVIVGGIMNWRESK